MRTNPAFHTPKAADLFSSRDSGSVQNQPRSQSHQVAEVGRDLRVHLRPLQRAHLEAQWDTSQGRGSLLALWFSGARQSAGFPQALASQQGLCCSWMTAKTCANTFLQRHVPDSAFLLGGHRRHLLQVCGKYKPFLIKMR